MALAAFVAIALGLGFWYRNRPAEADRTASLAGRKSSPKASSATGSVPLERPVQPPATGMETEAPQTTQTKLTTLEVRCPTCDGIGRLPTDKPGQTYTCPVCAGAGKRTRRYLPDVWRPCPTCGGMGAVEIEDDLFRTRNRLSKQTCDTCAGRGLVPVRTPR